MHVQGGRVSNPTYASPTLHTAPLPARPARSSWLEVDEFAQTLITSWPSATTGVDLGSDDCLCHYFGGLIPS